MGTLGVDEVNVRVGELKEQLLFGGRNEQFAGERLAVPVKPFCAVNVRTVDPDCPGLAIIMAVGLAEIAMPAPTSTELTSDVDPI